MTEEKELTTNEPTTNERIAVITRNQVKQNDTLTEINKNLKAIRNYLGFFFLMAILGLILGFCSAAL